MIIKRTTEEKYTMLIESLVGVLRLAWLVYFLEEDIWTEFWIIWTGATVGEKGGGGGVRAGCAEKCMCKGSEIEKNLAYFGKSWQNWIMESGMRDEMRMSVFL